MYGPKLPVTGVSFLVLGVSSFYNIALLMLLIVTLSIILFRFTRLLAKEGRFKKLFIIAFIALSTIFLIIYLGKTQAENKIKQSEEILIDYKNTLDNTNNNNIDISTESISTKTTSRENAEVNNTNYYPSSGETLGVIYIEKISLELPIIEDANEKNLWLGAAHIRGTPLYWEKGNSFLASHNIKTYGKLFNRINQLAIGDKIIISNSNDIFTYIVYDVEIVSGDDTECFNKIKGEYNLSLVVCTKSGGKRLIVYCERI